MSVELPDISYLTEEEQKQILSVVKRQQDEDNKEKAMIMKLQKQFESYKQHVKNEEQQMKTAFGSGNGQVCAMCNKTKLVEGCGHTCSYCDSKFCSRCGGRVTLKSNKMMWVCNLCRQRQDIITKTGAWYHGNNSDFKLRLEPVPAHEIIRKQAKMSGSASLAQIEGKSYGATAWHRRGSRSSMRHQGTKMRKGLSEPQLAQCEKTTGESEPYSSTICLRDKKEARVNAEQKENSSSSLSSDHHSSAYGRRRSSTHVEKVLRRQEQTVLPPSDSSVEDKQNLPSDLDKSTTGVPDNVPKGSSSLPDKGQSMRPTDKDTKCNEASQLPTSQDPADFSRLKFSQSVISKHVIVHKAHTPVPVRAVSEFNGHHDRVSASANLMNHDATSAAVSAGSRAESRVGSDETDKGRSLKAARSDNNRSVSRERVSKQQENGLVADFGLEQPSLSERADDRRPRSTNSTPRGSPRNSFSKTTKPMQSSPILCKPSVLSSESATRRAAELLSDNSVPASPRSRRHAKVADPVSRVGNLHHAQSAGIRSSAGKKPDLNSSKYLEMSVSDTEGSNRLSSAYIRASRSSEHVNSVPRGMQFLPKRKGVPGGSRRRIEQRRESFDSLNRDVSADGSWHANGYTPTCGEEHRVLVRSHPLDNSGSRSIPGHPGRRLPRDASTGNVTSRDSEQYPTKQWTPSRNRNKHLPPVAKLAHHSAVRKPSSNYRSRAGKATRRKPSVSSSDECAQSTPDLSSCDENDLSDTSAKQDFTISSRDHMNAAQLLCASSPWHGSMNTPANVADEACGNHPHVMSGRKRVHFTQSVEDRYYSRLSPVEYCSTADDVLSDATLKFSSLANLRSSRDSGVETSSVNTVSSSDPLLVQHSALWRRSADDRCMMGFLSINKGLDTNRLPTDPRKAVLGVKVSGGQRTETGQLGAFVRAVKKGSLADIVGQVKQGDEVIKWGGYHLQGATYEEVCEAVNASREKNVVELVISRPVEKSPRIGYLRQQFTESSSSSFDSHKHDDNGRFLHSSARAAENDSHDRSRHWIVASRSQPIGPRKLEVKLWYDKMCKQLHVTTVKAVNLPARDGGLKRNTYIKMYMLPDRSDSSKRRTKTVKKTLEPVWNQSFVYSDITIHDLESTSLELVLWDLDRSVESNNHFLGQVVIHLGQAKYDNMPHWYQLLPMSSEAPEQNYHAPRRQQPQTGDGSPAVAHPRNRIHPSHSASHFEYSSATQPHSGYVVMEQPRSTHGRRRPVSNDMNFNDDCDVEVLRSTRSTDSRSATLTSRGVRVRSRDDSLGARHDKLDHSQTRLQAGNCTTLPHSFTTDARSLVSSPALNTRRPQLSASMSTRDYEGSLHHSTHSTLSRSNNSSAVEQQRSAQQPHKVGSNRSSTDSQSSISRPQDVDQRTGGDRPVVTGSHDPREIAAGRKQQVRNSDSKVPSARQSSPSQPRNEMMSKSVSLGTDLHTTGVGKNGELVRAGSGSGSGRSTPRQRSTTTDGKMHGRKSNTLGHKFTNFVGIKNKSQSSSHLDQKNSSVRSTEFGVQPQLSREGSKDSNSGSMPSVVSEGSSVDKTIQDFLGGLGPGQTVDRQALGGTELGDLELGFYQSRSQLEVSVIRARGLRVRPNSKIFPATYVKVYLMFGHQVVAKKKTKLAPRGLDPTFDQVLTFDLNQCGNNVQITVLGDYGRLDSKAFMGVVQVSLDNLNLSSNPISWYKLVPTTSFIDATSLSGSAVGSMTSLESDGTSLRR